LLPAPPPPGERGYGTASWSEALPPLGDVIGFTQPLSVPCERRPFWGEAPPLPASPSTFALDLRELPCELPSTKARPGLLSDVFFDGLACLRLLAPWASP
jgi:hypothetical protein